MNARNGGPPRKPRPIDRILARDPTWAELEHELDELEILQRARRLMAINGKRPKPEHFHWSEENGPRATRQSNARAPRQSDME